MSLALTFLILLVQCFIRLAITVLITYLPLQATCQLKPYMWGHVYMSMYISTCLQHAMHMSTTCNAHVYNMQCTYLHVYNMQCTCLQHAMYMSTACNVHVYSMQCTCLHVDNMQCACLQHAMYMSTACNVHVYSMQCTCLQHAMYTVAEILGGQGGGRLPPHILRRGAIPPTFFKD